MAATLTYRYSRKRRNGTASRTYSKGGLIYRTPSEKGGYKAVQYSYRIQGRKPNVGGNASDK